jgi:hypothetical protein
MQQLHVCVLPDSSSLYCLGYHNSSNSSTQFIVAQPCVCGNSGWWVTSGHLLWVGAQCALPFSPAAAISIAGILLAMQHHSTCELHTDHLSSLQPSNSCFSVRTYKVVGVLPVNNQQRYQSTPFWWGQLLPD